MEDLDLRQPLLSQVPVESEGIPIYYNGLHHHGTTPFSTSPIFGISDDGIYEHLGGTEVFFLNLSEDTVFDKVQSRRGGETKMRVSNGRIKMVCKSSVQIMNIKVHVYREPSASQLCGDDNGKMELPVKMEKMDVHDNGTCKQFFSVDLNSIYHGPRKPAYELAKVETEIRNQFQLTVQVQYGGGSMYQEFTSIPFLLRTKTRPKKRVRLPESTESEEQVHSPDTSRPRLDSTVNHENSQNSPDSFMSSTENHRNIECQRLTVHEHLRAKQANIESLTFNVMESQSNADLGYRFSLSAPHLDEYEEGEVVGFFKDENEKTYVELLDNTNADQAFTAGVISESAYLVANQSLDKDKSVVVCVIGVVKVKCVGSVRTGERIYSSVIEDRAGTAISESNLPPGAVINKRGTLLGMALEGKKAKKPDAEILVKCFVCIVMGITDKSVRMEIENAYDRVEMMVNDKIKKERKRTKKLLCAAMSVLIFMLIGLSILTYQLYYPGSALRVHICKKGSIKDHWVTFKFTEMTGVQSYFVTGIEFPSWEKLQEKVKPNLDGVAPINLKLFNQSNPHYYLNLDRCSYGNVKPQTTLGQDATKQVGGPFIFAVDGECTTVYYYKDTHYRIATCKKNWCPYQSVSSFPEKFHCHPESEFNK